MSDTKRSREYEDLPSKSSDPIKEEYDNLCLNIYQSLQEAPKDSDFFNELNNLVNRFQRFREQVIQARRHY